MQIRAVGCTAKEQVLLRTAAQVALSRLAQGVGGLQGLDGLRNCMMAKLSAGSPVTIRCIDCESTALEGFAATEGVEVIGICRASLTRDQRRLNSLLFHELVHVCGGNELDSEGLEAHCFAGNGASAPSRRDFELFDRLPVENGYVSGRFLLWNPRTGELFVKGPDGNPGAPLGARFQARQT